ncbi:putative K+-dependent Na+/Ca+ exchanger protein [Methanocella paludicola SANAE]|uniref:K+-dependent Na+/Ca+ exchanger protein n=2 Tax=Methanocella TaxID=570266 RepID=D1Z0K2_METPS|nr:putative K+-dependent Na+/Ca+ exchanger protein [Methanocella paludicola SANAE]
MFIEITLIIIGMALLVKGADILVDNASNIAAGIGIPLVVIGLSVVAFGTSLPELIVGVSASIEDVGQIALGDVIGANIANICLILGACAVLKPIKIERTVAYRDIIITIFAVLTFLILSLDGSLDLWDGVILLTAAAAYFLYVFLRAVGERYGGYTPIPAKASVSQLLMLAIGLTMALVGGKLVVDSAAGIAGSLGISPYIIGVTLVAIGTTLPELTTGVIASIKGQGDFAIGNCLGSVCINYLLIMGICAAIRPIGEIPVSDVFISLITCMLLMPLVLRGFVLARWEGILLLIFYFIYIGIKIL